MRHHQMIKIVFITISLILLRIINHASLESNKHEIDTTASQKVPNKVYFYYTSHRGDQPVQKINF